MAYIRPPNTIIAGSGLIQDPDPATNIPSGVLPVVFNVTTATTSTLGGVIVGENIDVTPDGVISVADPIPGYTGSVGAQGPRGPQGFTGSIGPQGPRGYTGSAGGCGDDYTFGSWQPALVANVAGTISLSTRNANYTKIGQMVFCTFDIKINSITGGASTATIILSGLPVSAISSTGTVGSVFISFNSGLNTNIVQLSGTVINSSKQAIIWYSKAVGQNLTSLTQDQLANNAILTGTVSYISAT